MKKKFKDILYKVIIIISLFFFICRGLYIYLEDLATTIDIFLVFILVCVNIGYLHKLNEQNKLLIKDGKRNVILEEARDFLIPTKHKLENEIKDVRNNKIYCETNHNNESYIYFSTPSNKNYNKNIKPRIDGKYQNLSNNLSCHEDLHNKLNKLCNKIRNEIINYGFKNHLNDLINEYIDDGGNVSIGDATARKASEYVCIDWIISKGIYDNDELQDQHFLQFDFWNKYDKNLLTYINMPTIQNYKKEIKNILDELKGLNEVILKEIENIVELYQEEYDLTEYEINPIKNHQNKFRNYFRK